MTFIQGFHPSIDQRNKPNIESFKKTVRRINVVDRIRWNIPMRRVHVVILDLSTCFWIYSAYSIYFDVRLFYIDVLIFSTVFTISVQG